MPAPESRPPLSTMVNQLAAVLGIFSRLRESLSRARSEMAPLSTGVWLCATVCWSVVVVLGSGAGAGAGGGWTAAVDGVSSDFFSVSSLLTVAESWLGVAADACVV